MVPSIVFTVIVFIFLVIFNILLFLHHLDLAHFEFLSDVSKDGWYMFVKSITLLGAYIGLKYKQRNGNREFWLFLSFCAIFSDSWNILCHQVCRLQNHHGTEQEQQTRRKEQHHFASKKSTKLTTGFQTEFYFDWSTFQNVSTFHSTGYSQSQPLNWVRLITLIIFTERHILNWSENYHTFKFLLQKIPPHQKGRINLRSFARITWEK